MTINFPTSLDSLTNPAASDPRTAPSHAAQHADANDAIEALEAKVGINSSAVTTSLDYKWSHLTAAQYAASGNLTLTASLQDVAGCTTTITVDGLYLVFGVFDTDAGVNILAGQLIVGGVAQGAEAHSSSGRETVTQNWVITTSGSTVVKLQAKLVSGSGGTVYSGHTIMTVLGPL